MPLADERDIVIPPFALKPDGGRWESFLPERIDGDNVIASTTVTRNATPGFLWSGVIFEGRSRARLVRC
jgi:hypothetical protein